MINLNKSKKIKIVIVITILFIGVIILILLLEKKKERINPENKIFPTPTTLITNPTISKNPSVSTSPTQKPIPTVAPGIPSESRGYFLNSVGKTKSPVTGCSWLSDNLIYSTNKGIYYAGSNKEIKNLIINQIIWSKNGTALIRNNNGWFIFKASKGELNKISQEIQGPLLSLNGQKLLITRNSELEILNTENNTSLAKEKFNDKITVSSISLDGNWVAISQNLNNKNKITILDNNLKKKKDIEFDSKLILSSISPDGTKIFLFDKNKLYISNLSGQESIIDITDSAEIRTYWMNNEIFFLMESSYDYLGRKIDYIYKVENNKKEFIIDSKPIIKRLNTKIPIILNEKNTVISLIGNDNRLWLVSLIINKVPYYAEKGLTFLSVENKGI